ncbi:MULTISPECIES: PAAR domain-containing protein [Pseudomonas]|uniref:PAAR domain-containing protein n=1 Tax=Pseudomonas TaxID=286 RepID=UPI000D9BB061|nr:hypothetical protein DNK62_10800 [Pseudomonas sp. TKO30]PYY89883.1 hypothetical protein DNK61_10795 [Pseudomonas sp. TKO29]PYY92970.1 hypothetical protein DNK59_10800 [Pseudomonas sp. TKO26]PYZ00100.1 hypothetical protein DNK60_10795 [Pseudomonas sp. TKO14]
MAKPVARKTDSPLCPVPRHGIYSIAEGSPEVIFDGLPAARQGDRCCCGVGVDWMRNRRILTQTLQSPSS